MRTTLAKFGLAICLFFAVERFCHMQTKGFQLTKIQSTLSFNPAWETPELQKEERTSLQKTLNQPYKFLGSGGQCYAFLSADGQHVIKFFKHHHMRPDSFLNKIKLSPKWHHLRLKLSGGDQEKLQEIFNSCKIAYDHLKPETGMEYIHLNKTKGQFGTLYLIDRIGIQHKIPLDDYEFIVQKKALYLYPELRKLQEAHDLNSIYQIIDSLFELFNKRFHLLIGDRDPIFKRNFGIIDNHVVEFDQSSFYYNEDLKKPYIFKREMFYEMLKLHKWIHKKIPEAAEYFDKRYAEWTSKEDSIPSAQT